MALGWKKVSCGRGQNATRAGEVGGKPRCKESKTTLASYPVRTQIAEGWRSGGGGGIVGYERETETEARSGKGVLVSLRNSISLFLSCFYILPCVLFLLDAAYLDEVSLPDFELLSDPEDEHLCANLMQLLQDSLAQARLGSRRPARLLMPSQLVSQVGKELLRLAYSEPCGLRGALLDVCVEQGKSCHSVGQLALDPSLVPTFQLTLVLRLDSRLWPKIQGLFSSANSPFVPGFSQSLTLSTGFRVIKKKLYSSEQLLIEEC